MPDPPVRARPDVRVMLAARILLLLTVAAVAVIVLSPGPPDAAGQRALADWLARAHRAWVPGWVTFGLIEFAANVLMFLPLGLFGALAVPRRRALAVAACAAFSGLVEFVQWAWLPAREGSWGDILANSLGAALGFCLALLALRLLSARPGGPAGRGGPRPVTRGG